MGWGGRLVSQTCSVNPSSSLTVAERAQRVAGPENTIKSEMRDVSCREIYMLLFITSTTSTTSATSATCDHYRGGGDGTRAMHARPVCYREATPPAPVCF